MLPENINVYVRDGDEDREAGEKLELTVGDTVKLKEIVHPSDAVNKEVAWKVEDEQYATLAEDGTLNALKAGSTKVTVTSKAVEKV